MIVNKSDDPTEGLPKVAINFLFDKIRINFEEAQYRDLLSLASYFLLREKRRNRVHTKSNRLATI